MTTSATTTTGAAATDSADPSTRVQIFDADNHMYETTDAFTKFLPREYRKVIQYVDVRGRTKIAVNGAISEYIPNPTFEWVAPPGAMEEYFRHGNAEGADMREMYGQPMQSIPAFREPGARLELMDEQGVERTLMFPTLASLLEERLRDDIDATHAVVHALNEWMHETWTFDYEHRIYATPVITLPVIGRAIEELEWVLERGAKAVLIRPAPVPDRGGSRSMAMPEFDPFWQLVIDSGVLVTFHASDSGYDRYTNDWLGDSREFLPFQPNPFRMFSMWRPIEDTVASLVCHGTLTRFPDLKFAIVENGASWVGPLLDKFEELWKKMPQTFDEHPVETVKRALHISPFWEEDLPALAGLLGEDKVLFGSDYPHPEGMANPRSYLDELTGVDDGLRTRIMGANLANLMNLPAELPG